MARIGVVGAGAWGTALAIAAGRAGHSVPLWGRDQAAMVEMRRSRVNAGRLPGVVLDGAIEPTGDITNLVGCDLLLLSTPAQTLRQVVAQIPDAPWLVICAKGLERASGLRLSDVVVEARRGPRVAVLSGPSYAGELARGLPTAVTLAAPSLDAAQELSAMLAAPAFRLYPTDDVAGVEIGGALKNVIAIAAGAVMGSGLGENARAAVVTRGLAELARLGTALGARRETLMGLSGLGDLVLTATSLTSRNTRFGHELAQGGAVAELMGAGHALSEGAWTAESAVALGRRHGVELPISVAVADVLAGRATIAAAVESLLARPLASSE
ncbi:MAG TPA: NAD(P)H-dependent glycerol-3-phosphate dehydrogenase [Geminicoccaceae bacterium]|nr:NAD(P)H-dependent glycerol-3-phosphate dehydrogenase [Geminicoccus sp.]HMU50189.1 NAD(P)H-dependent glycerol-3-phosphate dehydrogenase [Geminicoccaceae bacterium]